MNNEKETISKEEAAAILKSVDSTNATPLSHSEYRYY